MNDRKDDDGLITSLRDSGEKIGYLYPILEDSHGNIIDGHHRVEAHANWPHRRLDDVKTEKERLIVKIVSNTCRRAISAREKTGILNSLGQILAEEGTPRGEIAKNIAEETGMSYTWVMRYLSHEYKDSLQSERAKSATSRVAKACRLIKRIRKAPTRRLIKIGNYQNTDVVFFFVKKPLYERISEASQRLNTAPDILIQNAIEEKLREISDLTREYEKVTSIMEAENLTAIATNAL